MLIAHANHKWYAPTVASGGDALALEKLQQLKLSTSKVSVEVVVQLILSGEMYGVILKQLASSKQRDAAELAKEIFEYHFNNKDEATDLKKRADNLVRCI